MSQRNTSSRSMLGDVPNALRRLLRAEAELGRSVVESLTGLVVPDLDSSLESLRARTQPSCKIPEPCWEPKKLGERTSHIGECERARLTLSFENCEAETKRSRIVVRGADEVEVDPRHHELVLGPLECGHLEIEAKLPEDTPNGEQFDLTVIIVGCRIQYLRWVISRGTFGLQRDHRVKVSECADQIHHWYDHFYCKRECKNSKREPGNLKDSAYLAHEPG